MHIFTKRNIVRIKYNNFYSSMMQVIKIETPYGFFSFDKWNVKMGKTKDLYFPERDTKKLKEVELWKNT
jgi:hypothetical protein